MSTLAASRADNFYFPPDGHVTQSKGSNQYEQRGIIRFELPFDGWCLGCNRHICRGHRFNAKKNKAGKYFSTQIWSFDMKCPDPLCSQRFEIRTDPENRTYDFASGIRKNQQDYTPSPDDSLIEATNATEKQLLATDPMFRLQREQEGERKLSTHAKRIESLEHHCNTTHRYDADMNAVLRRKNRIRKKDLAKLTENGRKRGLNIPLLDSTEEDHYIAKKVKFRAGDETTKLSRIQSQCIFGSKLGIDRDRSIKAMGQHSNSDRSNERRQRGESLPIRRNLALHTTVAARVVSSPQKSTVYMGNGDTGDSHSSGSGKSVAMGALDLLQAY